MMYAMTWNEEGTYMVQVGIEPVRLLEEVKKNEVDSVVSNMPMYEGMKLYVADPESGKIYGATDEEDIDFTVLFSYVIKKEIRNGIFSGLLRLIYVNKKSRPANQPEKVVQK